jgi:hypothetical protein
MVEHCSDGSTVWAAVPRLAAYSKLSERTVQRLIRQFCSCGILSELAPANSGKRRPATYRVNEEALQPDPKMRPYLNRQQQLPGIHRAAIPGEPITDRSLVTTRHQTGDRGTSALVTDRHQSGDCQTPDSKAFDSRTIDPKPVIHHGDAALNSLPAFISLKEQLRAEISDEEWNLWVRPMRLLKAMPVGPGQKHLLAAIPPNGRIKDAATKRVEMMREMLAPAGLNISLTKYPDEWEIREARKRFGIDMAPKPWTRKGSA